MAGAHGDVVMTYAAGDLQRGATEQATAAAATADLGNGLTAGSTGVAQSVGPISPPR